MAEMNPLGESPSSNMTELKLLDIWRSVLETKAIGFEDEFLDLGGDSLSAMVCISRIRRTFGYEMELEDFFMEHATIRSFASAIDQATGSSK
jgi:acyl carrier protein